MIWAVQVDEATGQVVTPAGGAEALLAAQQGGGEGDDRDAGSEQLAWLPRPAQMVPQLGYAVSAEFVVATRRVKQAHKAEIPLMHDPVARLEHVGCARASVCPNRDSRGFLLRGEASERALAPTLCARRRETVKKLADLRAAATEARIRLALPDALAQVTTVGQFVALANLADKDVALSKALQVSAPGQDRARHARSSRARLLALALSYLSAIRAAHESHVVGSPLLPSPPHPQPQAVLKLPKDKWDEVVAHAGQAVVPDFRPRVWYPPLDAHAPGVPLGNLTTLSPHHPHHHPGSMQVRLAPRSQPAHLHL